MISTLKISVRAATLEDRQQLASLTHFEPFVHRHLDWRPPLDWLGEQPFLVAERSTFLVAALACPLIPPEVAWIRLFAAAENLAASYAWRMLWPEAQAQLTDFGITYLAAIPIQRWFRKILQDNGFVHTYDVVLLSCDVGAAKAAHPTRTYRIHPMVMEDLNDVLAVDTAAFTPIWRNSLSSLQLAYQQSLIATVVRDHQGVVGYQISTPSPHGAHMARLAVHPRDQGQGIGYALVWDLLQQSRRMGLERLTVNTQHDNLPSLSLYDKAGFHRTGEEYPIYQYFFG